MIGHDRKMRYRPAAFCSELSPVGEDNSAGGGFAERREPFAAVEIFLAGQEVLALQGGELRRCGREEAETGVNFADTGARCRRERACTADGDEMRPVGDFPVRQAMAPVFAGLGHAR